MAYSPAFQFYPAEYLGDKNTFPMTTVEHGAYCLLMWFCWEEDGLPDDLDELAGMARLTVDQFKPIWDRRLKKCFVFDEKKNLYFHPRLLKEIKKQKAWKKEKSERGKRAAVSRWKQNGSGDAHALPTHADAMPKHASSSLSLSLNIKRLIERVRARHPSLDSMDVEIAFFETIVKWHNGNGKPIKSAAYFDEEVKHWAKNSKGLSKDAKAAILEKRRNQVAELMPEHTAWLKGRDV